MTTFTQRRLRNLGLTGLAAGAIVLCDHLYEISLRDSAFFNGWMLFAGTVFLGLLNLRKKLPVLPLLPAATWLQTHIYVGLLCTVLFLVHSKFRLPDGIFETTLWFAFVAVVVSGAAGLYLSRQLPPRISGSGERIIFERLPAYRARLSDEAQTLAIDSVAASGSSTIADFYGARLAPYFRRPRNLWAHLFERDAPLRRLRGQLAELKRFQDDRGQEVLARIDELVVLKNTLDRQHALQLTLKLWLFVHIPLAYGLLLLSVAHVLFAYALASGSP